MARVESTPPVGTPPVSVTNFVLTCMAIAALAGPFIGGKTASSSCMFLGYAVASALAYGLPGGLLLSALALSKPKKER